MTGLLWVGRGDAVERRRAVPTDIVQPIDPRHLRPQRRQHLRPEPRVPRLPHPGPPAWMRQREVLRQVVPERPHAVRDRSRSQHIRLGVGADQQGQAHARHPGQHPCPPDRRAFRPGRQVAAAGQAAGVAEAHRQDGDARRVVERVLRQAQPAAQAVAGGVGPGGAAGVGQGARRLAGDHQARGWGHAEDGPWAERQVGGADGAGPGVCGQDVQGVGCCRVGSHRGGYDRPRRHRRAGPGRGRRAAAGGPARPGGTARPGGAPGRCGGARSARPGVARPRLGDGSWRGPGPRL